VRVFRAGGQGLLNQPIEQLTALKPADYSLEFSDFVSADDRAIRSLGLFSGISSLNCSSHKIYIAAKKAFEITLHTFLSPPCNSEERILDSEISRRLN
jgi:hypothetical protein